MLYVNSIMEQEKGKAGDIFVNGDLINLELTLEKKFNKVRNSLSKRKEVKT